MKKLLLLTFDQTLTLDTLSATPWVSELSQDFELTLALIRTTGEKIDHTKQEPNLAHFWTIGLNSSNWFWIRHLFLIRALELASAIPSFRYRVKREMFGTLTIQTPRGFVANFRRLLTTEAFLYLLDYVASVSCSVKNYYEKWLKGKVSKSQQLEECIDRTDPHYILFLTSGYEQVVWEFALFDYFSVDKVFVLINNWDNLSSKSVLPSNFGGYLLWNGQQISYAKLQGIPPQKTKVVGSPKIDRYSTGYEFYGASKIGFPSKILYVGQQNYHDEEEDIKEIVRTLLMMEDRIEFYYRPHPSRKLTLKGLKSEVVSIPKIAISNLSGESYAQGLFGSKGEFIELQGKKVFIENSKRVPFQDYSLVIGPPTTLILESMGNRIPTVVITRHDRLSRTSGLMMWENMCHLWALRPYLGKGLEIASNADQLRMHILNFAKLPHIQVDESFMELFPKYSESFAKRITSSIRALSGDQVD